MFLSSTRVPSLVSPDGADAHVRVAAEAPLLEVAVVDADEDEDVAQRRAGTPRPRRALRRSGSPTISTSGDARRGSGRRPTPPSRCTFLPASSSMWTRVMPTVFVAPADLDVEVPALAERLVELADLVALGQVRIEVVLAREAARRRGCEHESASAVRTARRTASPLSTGQRARAGRGRPGRPGCWAARRTWSSTRRTPWSASGAARAPPGR